MAKAYPDELAQAGIPSRLEVSAPVTHKGKTLPVDFLVDHAALPGGVSALSPSHEVELLT